MASRPEKKLRDLITVSTAECVISDIYPAGDARGDYEIVFLGKDGPLVTSAIWLGSGWGFHPPAQLADATRVPRLAEYVALVRARPA